MEDLPEWEAVRRQEILDLLNRCAQAVHRKHWWELPSCCVRDVRLSGFEPEALVGWDSVADAYTRRLRDVKPSERYVGTVKLDVPNEDEAWAATHMLTEHAGVTTMSPVIFGFSYRDHVIRTGDGWRLLARQAAALWTTYGTCLDAPSGLRFERH